MKQMLFCALASLLLSTASLAVADEPFSSIESLVKEIVEKMGDELKEVAVVEAIHLDDTRSVFCDLVEDVIIDSLTEQKKWARKYRLMDLMHRQDRGDRTAKYYLSPRIVELDSTTTITVNVVSTADGTVKMSAERIISTTTSMRAWLDRILRE